MLRFLKAGLGMLVFRAAFMFALPPLVLAHEAHRGAAPVEATSVGEEASFLRENEVAMTKMMNGMAARPTGDVDRDFVAMMVPHHQGAIDMAVIELRYGKNEQLRRIAQEIIVDQMQEVAAMNLAIAEQVTASLPAPTQPGPPAPAGQDNHMNMNMSPEGMK
jgi:hypothetical protein